MDFFQNCLGLYCPPEREMTAKFCSKIMSGEKYLIQTKKLIVVKNVPCFKVRLKLEGLIFLRNSTAKEFGKA